VSECECVHTCMDVCLSAYLLGSPQSALHLHIAHGSVTTAYFILFTYLFID
jgi:hypothetical protein